ncbi:sigma-70 family RNA polymerase sigma factor [Myroides sp. N17-2]|uniref:sigma-70 family RNA polymerase sigma factor n=1 Tax=Myroides sp. N17-2 TaxID=2030799 RepID=UPI000EFB5412|nr:sigma-70 family RNA polymerase sigma factor [Myroides sp. N17-2]
MNDSINIKVHKEKGEDIQLFEQIALGSKSALEHFYVKYYKYLSRFAASYESDSYLVEEKISDVFLYLWENRETLLEINSPKVYVFTMLKNMLFQHKKKLKTQAISFDYAVFQDKYYSENIEEQIILSEQEHQLQKDLLLIINKIPAGSRRIFEMNRVDGLRYRQIAEILNISVRTVENHMSIALRTINKMLIQRK